MTNKLLAQGKGGERRPIGHMGRPIVSYFPQIRNFIQKKAGAEALLIFAEPEYEQDSGAIDWYSLREGEAVAFGDVTPVSSRREIEAELAKSLSELRALAREELEADSIDRRNLGEVLMQMTEYPGTSQVFAVGGKPVVVFWGFSNEQSHESFQSGHIAAPIGTPVESEPSKKSGIVGFSTNIFNICVGTALAIALLSVALRAAGVLPGVSAPLIASGPTLEFGPLQTARDQTRGLQNDIERISQETLSRALTCASSCTGPAKPLVPILPKPPKITNPFDQEAKVTPEEGEILKIPEESAETKSVEFLFGRWRNDSGLKIEVEDGTVKKGDVIYEFDREGKGTRTITVEDGRICKGDIAAEISEAGDLVIREINAAQCIPTGFSINAAEVVCKLNPGAAAICNAAYSHGAEYYVEIRRLK
jgi:hypothetical protein